MENEPSGWNRDDTRCDLTNIEIELLISGYIRQVGKQLNDKTIIPDPVLDLCFAFYDSFDSIILTTKNKLTLIRLMKESKQFNDCSFELIYRGSEHLFNYAPFHLRCDDRQKTLCIIQTDSDNIFAGYTSCHWNPSDGNWGYDTDAVIMLIQSSKNYKPQCFKVINPSKAIRKSPYGLCSFGGQDICIRAKCNENATSYTSSSIYKIPSPHYLNGDVKQFKVKEIEIYSGTKITFSKQCVMQKITEFKKLNPSPQKKAEIVIKSQKKVERCGRCGGTPGSGLRYHPGRVYEYENVFVCCNEDFNEWNNAGRSGGCTVCDCKPIPDVPTCTRCGQRAGSGKGTYHPGQLYKHDDGKRYWTCCIEEKKNKKGCTKCDCKEPVK